MLRVADNGRFLVHADGSPFFYLGDTGWTLLQRLDSAETDRYLADRAAKGFTAIQVMGISEFDGLTVPNRNGDLPLNDLDPTRPNDAYWRHVDTVIARANGLGLWVALLPTWADKVGPRLWGTDPEVFTPENAGPYGEYLGERYRDRDVIWVLGGDRNPTEERHLATWRAMAAGLARGDGGRHLMTFHPQGRSTSATFVHDEPWLGFNMIQSGHHQRDFPNHAMIAADYARTPVKPCMDGEPCYEDHPVDWKPEQGHFDDWDVRKAAYWSLFAGACGHTYGANSVFQFWRGGDPGKFGARRPWQEALDLPGAGQVRHARHLLEARPGFDRLPDQGLIVSDAGMRAEHVRATRASDGRFALVYVPRGDPVTVNLGTLSGRAAATSWYDPRTGEAQPIGERPASGAATFEPPSRGAGNDWVLVLDDAGREFEPLAAGGPGA